MAKNIHAGHGKQDSKSCGAGTTLMKESIENRPLKDELIKLLRNNNETIYDCTVDYPSSASDCINKIIKLCNAHKVDLDASIHFNSGRNNINGDGKIGGVEIILYDNSKNSPVTEANRILKKMEALGFTNRGIKYNKNLGVLRDTKAPAMIIEVCFVDDSDDTKLYYKLGYKVVAKAIAEGILNKTISVPAPPNPTTGNTYYRVCTGSFKDRSNADQQIKELESKGYKPFIFIHKD